MVDQPDGRALGRTLKRLAVLVTFAICVALTVQFISAKLRERQEPAGFFQGMAQGALMPMSLPNLLFGRDVAIYAERNTGIPYKAGYALGVNVCGFFFFGLLFSRRYKRKT